MLIRELSASARKQLSEFGFKDEDNINKEIEGGNVLGFFSFTPLMYAAYNGYLGLVKELVKSQAELDKKDQFFEFTALMWAADQGKYEIVSYLLINDADLKHKSDSSGMDAYELSKKKSCCSIQGFFQRAQKIIGTGDIDKTHKLISSFKLFNDPFSNYKRKVDNYIKTGELPARLTKQQLFDKAEKLNIEEKKWLISMTKDYLPQCASSNAYSNIAQVHRAEEFINYLYLENLSAYSFKNK